MEWLRNQMKQRRSEAERTGGENRIGGAGTSLYRFRIGGREKISDRERIGEIIKERKMRRKSPFVRDVKRIERREPWRKKHVRKETNRTGGDTASDEQTQPSTEAEKVDQVKEVKEAEEAKS